MKQPLPFTKMHALGNDFVLVDFIRHPQRFTEGRIRSLAHRHKGIGFDQLLCVEPPPSPTADFFMRIYNADGSEAEQCGNGARCFYEFVRTQGLTRRRQLLVQTKGGEVRLSSRAKAVWCDMGTPDFAAAPLVRPRFLPADGESLSLHAAGREHEVYVVSFGNPHCLVGAQSAAELPRLVGSYGELLATHTAFRHGANVGFFFIRNKRTLLLHTYERGVGPTLACGSNICAAAAVVRRHWQGEQDMTVHSPGGNAQVKISAQGRYCFGSPINYIYQGEIP